MRPDRTNRLTAAYVVLVSAVAALAFDVDRDRDVDLADYETVFTCLTESGSPLAPDCFVADIDGNGRVDLRDFGAYQVCFSGEGIEAAQECLPLRVEIGAPDNVLLGYPTNLGAAVTNPGGQTVFQWTIVDGLAVLEGDALQSPTIRALSDDPIQLAVTVTDTDSSWVAYDFVAIGVVNEPMDPEVDILVVPATTVDEDSVLVLKAEASDPLGLAIVEISWTQFGGPLLLNPFSNPTSASTNFNTCCPGTYSVAVVARNELGRIAKATTQLVINDIDSPRDLRVDGGPDRTFIPVPADFAGAAPFGVGAALYAGSPGGVVPNLSAVVNRSPTVDLAYQWSVTQTPDGTDSGDVVILNESLPDPGYLILPEVTNTTPTLNSTGLTGTISSVVMPGAYEFTVEVTDLETLENSTDSVTFTIVPAFGIPAGAGALQGPALENGSLRHHVTSPDSFDQSVTVLTRLAGTLNFHLQDVGNNTVAATIDLNGDGAVNAGDRYADFVPTQLLNSVGAAPPSPLDTFDVVANVSSIFRGTYLLQASLSAGTASAAPGPNGTAAYLATAGGRFSCFAVSSSARAWSRGLLSSR